MPPRRRFARNDPAASSTTKRVATATHCTVVNSPPAASEFLSAYL
jgi:hypothetical protein